MAGMRYQPQGLARLDRSNPLTAGLIQAFAGTDAYDAASGQMYTTLGTPVRRGDGIEFSTKGAGFKKLAAANEKPTSYTMAVLVKSLGSGDSFASIIGMSYAGNDSPPYGAQIDRDAGNGLRFVFNNGSVQAFSSSAGGLTIGATQWVFATFTSGAQALYVDGTQVASGTASGVPSYSGASSLNLGQMDGLQRNPNCIVYEGLIYDRVLSRAEMDALMANPWQVFDDQADEDELLLASGAPARHTLTVAGATQTSASGSVAATQRHKLGISASSQTSSSPTVSAKARAKLVIAAASQSSASPAIAVKSRHALTLTGNAQSSASPAVTIKARHKIAPNAATQTSASPSVAITVPQANRHSLTVASVQQGATSPAVGIKARHRLATAALVQQSASPALAIRQRQVLGITGSTQGLASPAVVARARMRLTMAALTQSSLSPSVRFTVAGTTYTLDPRRVLTLGAETRRLTLGAENRALDLGIDNRILETQGG